MKSAFLFRAVCAAGLLAGAAQADLIINEVVDGTLTGGQPKWVELKNTGNTSVDVTLFEIANYNNGSTTPGGGAGTQLTGGSLAAGGYFIVAYEFSSTNSTYSSVYGDTPDQFIGPFINGDDVVAVQDFASAAVLDVYGVIGVDGTGQPWEYTDSYAYGCGRTTASAVFTPTEWTAAGANALEDPGGDPVEKQNLLNFTSPRGETTAMGPSANNYCTAGTSASGCQAIISAVGTASSTATSGFLVSATGVEGKKFGQFFYGQNGQKAIPWGNGSSFQCVMGPTKRGGLRALAGTPGACDGCAVQDLNARWCPACPKAAHNPMSGMPIQIQYWYRDPNNTSSQTTSLSDAIEVMVSP